MFKTYSGPGDPGILTSLYALVLNNTAVHRASRNKPNHSFSLSCKNIGQRTSVGESC